jgi:flagellar hook protein FlgE
VYDSLGAPHTAEFYFRKLQDTGGGGPLNNTWQVMLYVDGTEIPPSSTGITGGAASAAPDTAGVLEFGTDGRITNARYNGGPLGQTSIAYSSFLPAPATTLTTGAALIDLTVDYNAMTQYGSEFAVNALSQDGFTTGRLSGFDVEDSGVVFARYTNGNAEVLGMVALGNVPNPQGLRQKGDSLWVESFDAGDLVLGQPGTSSLGLIQSGALESSTVEISDELVNMIVAQRNYQANAQVITTADQLTQTLLNIR